MRITYITTVSHNVGDDFVREGISYLFGQLCPDLEESCIHKHLPVTARPEADWFHAQGWSKRLDRFGLPLGRAVSSALDSIPLRPATDRVLTADLLVQSGAPIYWLNRWSRCDRSEWFGPLIKRRWASRPGNRPFLNLAGGTCQHYSSTGEEFTRAPRTLRFIRELFDRAQLTTLRDRLSADILRLAGREGPVLPCTSIFARRKLNLEAREPDYIALNYMPAGGHYALGQPIDSARWERTFFEFAHDLARQQRCVMVCHNLKELEAARRWAPDLEYFYSENYREVLSFYASARYGMVNRVHAAFAIASYGRPSFIVGSDSRARMAGMIGLKSIFVNDATKEILEEAQNSLESDRLAYATDFERLRAEAETSYLSLLSKVIPL